MSTMLNVITILLLALGAIVYAGEGDELGVDVASPDPLPVGNSLPVTAEDLQPLLEVAEKAAPVAPEPRDRPAAGAAPLAPQSPPLAALPTSFDARLIWPDCRSISLIWNQGQCMTCWAVTAASVLTDRWCIANGQRSKLYFSASQIAACTTPAQSRKENCDMSGNAEQAMSLAQRGLQTGGVNASHEGCIPYDVPKNWVLPNKIGCETDHCTNPRYNRPGDFVRETYATYGVWMRNSLKHPLLNQADINNRVIEMKREIMAHGPIVADFSVYAPFRTWKFATQGPYSYVRDVLKPDRLGGHYLRILGWGVDKGVEYWIAANTWGKKWGDKDGFAWVAIGSENSYLERNLVAPLIYDFVPPLPGPKEAHLCSSANFNRLPVEQAIPTSLQDSGAPFYLFQDGCVQRVMLKGTGLVTVGPALSTRWIFQSSRDAPGAPDGKIVRYKIIPRGNSPRIFLANEAGTVRGCNRVTDSKFVCDATAPQPQMDAAGPRATIAVAGNLESWTWAAGDPARVVPAGEFPESQYLKNPDAPGGRVHVGDLITANFGTATAFLHLDAQRMAVFGKKIVVAGAAPVPVSGILNYPVGQQGFRLAAPITPAGILEIAA